MTKLPLMMWNWGLKRQHPDCLSMGIKNLAELSLMSLSGLEVIFLPGIAACTEVVAYSSKKRAQNTISSQIYDSHILQLMLCLARHKPGKKIVPV